MNKYFKITYWKTINLRRRRWMLQMQNLIAKEFRRELRDVRRNSRGVMDSESLLDAAQGAVTSGAALWQATLRQLYVTVGDDLATVTWQQLTRQQSAHHGPEEEKQGEDALGLVRNIWLTELTEFIERVGGAKIKDISDTSRRAIQREITAGITAGEGIPKLKRRIDSLYLDSIIPRRSIVIARTETIVASNLGSRVGALNTQLPLEKEWLATLDKRTRSAHTEVDGQRREMNTPYDVDGEQLMYPADSSLGASGSNVIQCRCTEVYHVVTAQSRLAGSQ